MKRIKVFLKKYIVDIVKYSNTFIGFKKSYRTYYKAAKKKIYKNNLVPISSNYMKSINRFWEEYNLKVNSGGYKYFYKSTQNENPFYIPEDVFFKHIINKLNRFDLVKAYMDKNNYDKIFDSIIKTPNTIIRKIGEYYYDYNYNLLNFNEALDTVISKAKSSKIIIKPSIASGGGKDVILLDLIGKGNDELHCTIDKKIKNYDFDYIVQEFFKQTSVLDHLYPYSVNTMRIVTFEFNGDIKVLASILKVGNNKSHLDKVSEGGFSCGINSNGSLNDYALGKDVSNKIYEHPITNVKFKDIIIPNFDVVLSKVKLMHSKISPYFKFISWDMTLSEKNEPVLIEMNLRNQGINLPQLHCGPIFGENTKEILNSILKKRDK